MDNNLRSIVNRQMEVLSELENEVNAISNSDLAKENEKLKSELEKINARYAKAERDAKALSDQNASLKNALHEHIYNEKISIVNGTSERLNIYFKSAHEGASDRLTEIETAIRNRIDIMRQILHRNNIDVKDEVYAKLDELSVLLNQKVTDAKANHARYTGAFSENEHAEFESLKNEQITDEQMIAIAEKNNFERFVGLNLLNIIGILLIIIGAVTFANFVWGEMPDVLKGLMLFALGGVMLVAGELLNRKKPNIFSLGITAGGVAVLYVALATSYFGLEIMGMYIALALCILITAAAFFLSTRYNSQTILAIALVGGYLPMFSIEGNITLAYGSMVYFVALNLLALLVSFKKKWIVASFTGLFLNIIGIIVICSKFVYGAALASQIVVILYVIFAFLVYTLIPIAGTYTSKLKFENSDIILLAINTFISSLITYWLFYSFGWNDFTGVLAIIFAVIYLFLGRFVEKKFTGEKNAQALFYLTGLAFAVLIIPFQFGRAWLTLGWLAEGVALTTYGILYDEKIFKRAGFAINGLCLWSFLFFDLMLGINRYLPYNLFAYKYFLVTLGSLIVLGAYMYRKMVSSKFQKVYKYGVIVNLWFYAMYVCVKLNDLLSLHHISILEYYNTAYLTVSLAITLTFIIAYFAPRIKVLSDKGTKVISIILYIVGIAWLFGLNCNTSPIQFYEKAVMVERLIGTVILVLISLFSVFAMRDMLKIIVMERKLGVEWYPMIVSGYFVIILTQNLISQYNLSFASMWISIIYVLTALAWIIFGFVGRYSFIRRFGLGLALLSVVKLFIIDLANLTRGYQIVSYFALGITLIAISFVYQYFNKRLELKLDAEVTGSAEENN